jgi:hypothetical protein
MNEVFKKACEEAGIPYETFPFDFPDSSPVDYASLTAAMLWIQRMYFVGLIMKMSKAME